MAKLFPTIGTFLLVLWILFIFLAPKAFATTPLDYRSIDTFADDSISQPSDDDEELVFCLRFMKAGDRSQINDCNEFCRNSLGEPHFGEWRILRELVEALGGENVTDLDSETDYSDSQNPDLVQNGDKEFCFICTDVYS